MNKPPFGFLLYDTARLLRRDFDRRTRTVGLSRAKWSVLAHLSRNEGIRQAGLAEILDISPITLTRHLDRLELEGLVERRADPHDRRAYQLYLTAAAGPALEALRSLAEQARAAALAGLSDTEREELIRLLHKVRCNLSADRNAVPQASDS
ncbi:MAG TPA: MarR family transcriptional regulator [Gammaproteobacteria bacterium]|nr:MarR family transcriptional regulator [Gammaproteobacteria bacterium]